jgi:hypothetical protein
MDKQYSTRTGLLAYFDILGYQNFILHSNIQLMAKIIHEVILPVPDFVRNEIAKKLAIGDAAWTAEVMAKCIGKPVVISDSIVWDISFKPSLKEGKYPQWLLFIGGCCHLQRLMFDQGLPLRGAISYGEYYIEKGCFAGKPVVDAHGVSSKLDLVGCGLTLQAEKELPAGDFGGIDALGGLLETYTTPLKGCKAPNMKLLNWAFPGGTLLKPFGDDIRGRVVESFSRYGKPIPIEVYDKVTNTEAFLKGCKAAKQVWDMENPPPEG